jgi:hypothetical protein
MKAVDGRIDETCDLPPDARQLGALGFLQAA